MPTVEENEKLTQVGPGTPMGNLLRRYWHPIAAVTQLDENPVKKVKILGESLVLYRDRSGQMGLLSDTCAHRRINLAYGIPEGHGLRCAYHGWLYDATGQCIEMPAEPPDTTFPSRVKIGSYPVQELCGLIFAYLGPEPAPLLPRWDEFVWDNVLRDIGFQEIPCNWLQMQENNVDPAHLTWLHGHFSNYVLERLDRPDLKRGFYPAQGNLHQWDFYENGIIKRSRPPGAPETDPHWSTGLGFIFPNLEIVLTNFQYRVPMDDTHTLHVYFSAYPQPPGEVVKQDKVPHYRVPLPMDDPDGNPYWDMLDSNGGQDALVWILQGAKADRTQERLGESDRGILIFRELMRRQLDIVHEGGEPINVFRDPAKNVCIDIPRYGMSIDWELTKSTIMRRVNGSWKYSPVVREMVEKYEGREALLEPIH